jgi:hypothetical protein
MMPGKNGKGFIRKLVLPWTWETAGLAIYR